MTGIADISQGQPAYVAGMQPGDRIIRIAGQPVNDDTGVRNLSSQYSGKPTTFTVLRDGKEVDLTITPNSTTPYLGVVLTPWLKPATVAAVYSGGAEQKAGLQNGDVITQVNGQPVDNTALVTYLVNKAINDGNGSLSITVQRNGETIGPVSVDPKAVGLFRPYTVVYYGPFEALGRALNNTWSVVASIPAGIAQTFAGKSDGPGVTSIVGISQLTGEVAQEAGFNGLLNLMALLSISLFMINLLPLPALDGGRLLFIFIELVRGGRRIAPEKEGMVHFAGMMVLLALMAIITFFDVSRLFQGIRLLP